jgi:hypothetical protein
VVSVINGHGDVLVGFDLVIIVMESALRGLVIAIAPDSKVTVDAPGMVTSPPVEGTTAGPGVEPLNIAKEKRAEIGARKAPCSHL